MSDDNHESIVEGMREAIRDAHTQETYAEAAFKEWYELNAPGINPLLQEADARKVFKEGWDWGRAYARQMESSALMKLVMGALKNGRPKSD